jgi:hypothetical protein
MAQAQKLVATAGIERFVGFAGNLAQAYPEILDKIDMDQVVDEYGDMLGVPQKIVRPEEVVAAIRQQRAEAAQRQQMADNLAQAAQGAKLLSEADTTRESMLSRALGQ